LTTKSQIKQSSNHSNKNLGATCPNPSPWLQDIYSIKALVKRLLWN